MKFSTLSHLAALACSALAYPATLLATDISGYQFYNKRVCLVNQGNLVSYLEIGDECQPAELEFNEVSGEIYVSMSPPNTLNPFYLYLDVQNPSEAGSFPFLSLHPASAPNVNWSCETGTRILQTNTSSSNRNIDFYAVRNARSITFPDSFYVGLGDKSLFPDYLTDITTLNLIVKPLDY